MIKETTGSAAARIKKHRLSLLAGRPRYMTCLFWLSDDVEGGETVSRKSKNRSGRLSSTALCFDWLRLFSHPKNLLHVGERKALIGPNPRRGSFSLGFFGAKMGWTCS